MKSDTRKRLNVTTDLLKTKINDAKNNEISLKSFATKSLIRNKDNDQDNSNRPSITSNSRKSVWFRDESPDQFIDSAGKSNLKKTELFQNERSNNIKSNPTLIKTNNDASTLTKNNFNDTFGRATHYQIDEEVWNDEVDDTSADLIPDEGDKRDIRLTWFSASKNNTNSSEVLFGQDSKNKPRRSTDTAVFIKRKPFSERSLKSSPSRPQTQYNYRTTNRDTMSSSKGRVNSSTRKIDDGYKVLASHLKRYAELEKKEVDLRNALCKNENFNIEFAFRLLNPINGVVSLENLHSAIITNLQLPVVNKEILRDIIQRLAYVKDNELVLSDMGFFEPTIEDESYEAFRSNLAQHQNAKDKSWHPTYRLMWKTLIDTAKERRIIQNKMITSYPNVVNELYSKFRTRKMHR